jgi:hypothetical protein
MKSPVRATMSGGKLFTARTYHPDLPCFTKRPHGYPSVGQGVAYAAGEKAGGG